VVRLVLVHGFTQTGRSWAPLVERFTDAGHEVVTPDVAGHGSAGAVQADLAGSAALLVDTVGPDPAVWLGYSMGGRVCLHVALDHPAAVSGLVLVSTTAGIDDPAARARRRTADEALAAEVADGGDAGLPGFVDRWLAGPLWATLPREAAGVDARLRNTAAGLASSLRRAGSGTQRPLWDRLSSITVPVLVATGALDSKFTALGRRLASGMGGPAERIVFSGAGHAVPWERPDDFVAAVNAWLASQGPGPP